MHRSEKDQKQRLATLISLYRKTPERYLTLQECKTPEFLTLYLDDSVNLGFADPALAKARADVAIELARVIDDKHLTTRALFSLAQYHKNRGDRQKTLEIIFDMEERSPDCPCCLSFAFQMCGILLFNFEEDQPTALVMLNEAIRYARENGDEGQVAKILVSRGPGSYYVLKDLGRAMADLDLSQKTLPKDAPSVYAVAILTSTAFLLQFGEEKDFEKAKDVIAKAREWLKGLVDLTLLRYMVMWVDGLLKFKTGDRKGAINMLKRSSKGFKDMKLDKYYLAVQADLGMIYLEKNTFYAIKRLFEEKVDFLKENSRKLIDRIMLALRCEDKPLIEELLYTLRLAQDVSIPALI